MGILSFIRAASANGERDISNASQCAQGITEDDLERIASARHHNPHAVLGRHAAGAVAELRVFLPAVTQVTLDDGRPLQRLGHSDFFLLQAEPGQLPLRPALHWQRADGSHGQHIDPYSFAATLSEADCALFTSGHHAEAWKMLGAHPSCIDGIDGVRFGVWAPHAERVSVVGDLCDWDGRRLPLRSLGSSGIWELFVPGLAVGEAYKFEIRPRDSDAVLLKTDPWARAMELRPATASIITDDESHRWQDDAWMQSRLTHDWLHAPMSIYEVHLGSWRRAEDGGFLDWDTLAAQLIEHVQQLHFTHIELLPITEHPLDDSWGYQTTGYFAPTRRFGPPAGLKRLIDACHCAGIGVLLDWVPAHFPRDEHGLARFDGEPLFEYADARKGEHLDWGTYVFDYGRNEVRSFLLSSACYWLEHFHFDGLRVDAVASMLHLDFGGRTDYPPNRLGGRENLEAMDFLQQLNCVTHARSPGTVIMAEESTDWAGVSRPVDSGGLGFSMKWNLGWMHDTLDYLQTNPLFRGHVQDRLTFYLMYAWSENFILPLSHDEVVHLKRSLLGRMPGDRWQQLANLRLLYAWMWLLPGKKLLFMGSEFAQPWEWDFRSALPWDLLEHAEHRGVQQLVSDLNKLYVSEPALHRYEFDAQGFEWIDCHDRDRSVLAFLRRDGQRVVLLAANFTPVPRPAHRIGVPAPGLYEVRLNTDASLYGGVNTGNAVATAEAVHCHGHAWSVVLDLPALGALVLMPCIA